MTVMTLFSQSASRYFGRIKERNKNNTKIRLGKVAVASKAQNVTQANKLCTIFQTIITNAAHKYKLCPHFIKSPQIVCTENGLKVCYNFF